jgi:UDP-glucose 4-epimerase
VTVLILGASGLIGGRLISHLLGQQPAPRVRAASRRIRSWPAGVEGVMTDCAEPPTLARACADVDAVVNLASMPERACAEDPFGALQANVGGTHAIAKAAADAGVSRFVQVSTFKVYGDSLAGRITEAAPTAPRSHYALTHRASEDYAAALHPSCVTFRLSNGFGAPIGDVPAAWTIIVNEMCREAVDRRTVTIRSSGLAWRNFVPMQAVVRGLTAALESLPPGTYNLGAEESMTLREAAARVAAVCERTLAFRPQVCCGTATPGEYHERLDFRIDKLAAAGFRPDTAFDDEVRETLLAIAT